MKNFLKYKLNLSLLSHFNSFMSASLSNPDEAKLKDSDNESKMLELYSTMREYILKNISRSNFSDPNNKLEELKDVLPIELNKFSIPKFFKELKKLFNPA